MNKQYTKDIIYSFLALGILNATTQIVLFPVFRHMLGATLYGEALYLIGCCNVMAASIGISANLGRLKQSTETETQNIDPIVWVLSLTVICFPICIWIGIKSVLLGSATDIILFWTLVCLTSWRMYADVEFRLNLNFRGYFYYYLCISLGYLLGLLVSIFFDKLMISLLIGELFGLILVLWKGSVLQLDTSFSIIKFKGFTGIATHLFFSQLMLNLILNADRFILNNYYGGKSVSQYYIASLMGKTIALITGPLNAVIIGHLAKSKTPLKTKTFIRISGVLAVSVIPVLLVCYIATLLFSNWFYPNEAQTIYKLIIPANLAQILYFVSGVVLTVLLRYIDTRLQTIINAIYTVLFLTIVIAMTARYGLVGFAWSLVFVNAFRLILSIIVGGIILSYKTNKA